MAIRTIRIPVFPRKQVDHSVIANITQTLEVWRERSRQRRHLAALSAEQLDDIGITAGEARAESTKPRWQA